MNSIVRNGATLSTVSGPLRQIAIWLLVCLTIGYSTGLLFVYHTTGVTPAGVADRYRGNQPATTGDPAQPIPTSDGADDGAELQFEKSFAEMLNITHTHILSMATFFALTAGVFAFAQRPSKRLRSFLIVEPFVAIVTSFFAMWLMRYVHNGFSYLLMLSSASMALCFYTMVALSLRELAGRRGADDGTERKGVAA